MASSPQSAPRRALLFGTAGATLLAAGTKAAPPLPSQRLTPDPALADHGAMIQTAIDALEAAGGGRLELGPGIYHCISGPILLDCTRTSLIGEKAILDFTQPGSFPDPAGALIITTRPGSSQYGQASQRVEGIALRGPGLATPLAAILFTSAQNAYSARISLYNLDISGFADGLRFADRAYLIQIFSTTIQACGNCVMAPPHLQDAGENITFYGCTLGNSHLAICNPGGFELNFFGTSFDYVAQWYQGGGLVNFYGCHFEKQRPITADPLFDLHGRSTLNFHGGFIMVSGVDFDPNPKNAAVFNLPAPTSRVTLNDVEVYNLRSSGGILASGPGRLVTNRLLGGTNKRIDPIPSAARNADLFGGMGAFPGTELRIDADVISDSADTARASAHYGTLALGNGALSVSKTGGAGNGLSLRLFCPIAPLQIPSVVFQWQPTGAAAAPATIWVTLNVIQKIGQDHLGRTKSGASTTIGPLITLNPGFDGSASWTELYINALNMTWDLTDDATTPSWATHLCININLIELSQNTGFSIKALRAFAF